MSNSACCVWDFTIGEKYVDKEALITTLKKHCKKWSFQLEQGEESGYTHYQGRISLKMKKRKPELIKAFEIKEASYRPTSNENKDNDFYAVKEDTRIAGPWTDKDQEIYIPRQYRGIKEKFYPWQQDIWDRLEDFEPRIINIVYDPVGGKGKSTLRSLAMLLKNGYRLPSENDGLKCIQSMCDMLIAKQDRTPGPIFVDLPRAMDQRELHGMYRALEQIKDGHVYELRHRYQEWWFDSPQIWVFCNTMPEGAYLSKDRWKVWTIEEDLSLRERDDP